VNKRVRLVVFIGLLFTLVESARVHRVQAQLMEWDPIPRITDPFFNTRTYRPPVFREEALKSLVPGDPASRTLIEVDELVSKPEIPPAKRTTPVLKELPPSFVPQSYGALSGNYDITGLDVGRRRSLSEPAVLTLNSYVLDSAPAGVGRVVEIEVGMEVASVGQAVFVRMEKGVRPGDRFSVVRERGMIPLSSGGNAHIIEAGGTLEITGVADDSKNIYRAIILSSVNPITVGSVLIERELPTVTFAASGSVRGVEARVIGGEFDSVRNIFGESAIVYLEGGAERGLQAGDLLYVQAIRKTRRPHTEVPEWRRPIGLLKVVTVGQNVATAVVLQAQEEIRPGDLTGGDRLEESLPVVDDAGEVSDEGVESIDDLLEDVDESESGEGGDAAEEDVESELLEEDLSDLLEE